MRLAVISDLHRDINRLSQAELRQLAKVLLAGRADRLHFAGDTANQVVDTINVVDFFSAYGLEVTFNFGNHEMISLGEEEIEHFPDKHFLNNSYIFLNDSTVLLGLNGWYDYSFSAETDEGKIYAMKQLYWYDRNIKREGTDKEVNDRILANLIPVLDQLYEQRLSVILATHFVPKQEFIFYRTGKYARWNELNAFLGAKSLGQVLDRYDNIQQVIFGHTHFRFPDQMLNGTIYSCRPFGYFYEWRMTRDFILANQLATKFNPLKARSLVRDNWDAFDTYVQAHIQSEFEQAITWIEY